MQIIKSLSVFILAGFCEIGGGYLIWQWLKQEKSPLYAITGALLLIFYGVVATWQDANFARTYATYGGVFIAMSLLWAWKIDGFKPDRYDVIGAFVALVGVCIIIYSPRG